MVLVRSLVFDMDGVLIHSNPWHERVWLEYCRQRGVELSPDQVRWMYGRRNDEIAAAFFPELENGGLSRIGKEKEALFRKLLQGRVRDIAVPGLHALLDRHRSLPAAVASNAELANIAFAVGGLGLWDRFTAIVGGEDVARPKPDPEVYLRAAARLGSEPAACVAFEDTAPGVAAARAAGMQTVGISTTTTDLPGAGLVVPDFRSPQLAAWLAPRVGRDWSGLPNLPRRPLHP